MSAKILIIDDDKFTRQVLRKILERDALTARFEPEILVASNGIEGVEIYERERPPLVIVDLFMPKMDGFAVCRRLRELAGPDRLTIAVTSGVYKDATIARQIEDEFEGHFFAKPYQLKNVAEFAARALAPHAVPRPAEVESKPGLRPMSSGDLVGSNAATLFWDLLEQEKTGRLVMRHGQVVRQIELFVGHPVSVTTNVREEALGHFLVSRGLIDSPTHRQAMANAAASKRRLGETLIEMGLITPQELLGELTAQTRLKLVRALRWQEGSWGFRPTAPRNSPGNALDFAEVIITGLAGSAQVDPPSPEIRDLRDKPLVLTERGQRILSQLEVSVSAAFVRHFRSGITPEQMSRQGVNLKALYTCLDVLHTSGGLEAASNAIPTEVGIEHSEPMHLSLLADSGQRQAPREELFAALFDHETAHPTRTGANPLASLASTDLWRIQDAQALPEQSPPEQAAAPTEPAAPMRDDDQDFEEDSVVNVTFSTFPSNPAEPNAQEDLLTEFLRIQSKSFYEILQVPGDATQATIEAAHAALSSRFAKDQFNSEELGRDYPKLNSLRAAYDQALDTLSDDSARQIYDDSLFSATNDMPHAPSMDAEVAFHQAEELLAAGSFDLAISGFETSVAMAPHEAAYHSSLGWAHFLRGAQTAEAAELALPHLHQALSLSPEDGLAHEYLGRIHAILGDDLDAAIVHLGKALDDDPRRSAALVAIEKLHLGRDELRALEVVYRRLILRLADTSGGEEAIIWSRLGDLHAHYMHDEASALIAYERALELAPQDPGLQAKLQRLQSASRDPFYLAAESLASTWKAEPGSIEVLRTLFARAQEAQHYDGCFMAASALLASGSKDPDAEAWYQRYRARFVVRTQQLIEAKTWSQLVHQEDIEAVGALYALLEPILQSVSPPAGSIEELDKADPLKESALPADFLALRNYVAHVLGVAAPEVRARSDYQRMISVTATSTPVLLAGYEILTCTDKLELCFRLARAMSFLRPGRATAAGSRARTLKSAMLACYTLGSPLAKVPDPDGKVELFKTALAQCDGQLRSQLSELVTHIAHDYPTLNLSQWSRMLGRSADRVGLLLCGDLPLSARLAAELGGESAALELTAFAISPQHLLIRGALGVSIEV